MGATLTGVVGTQFAQRKNADRQWRRDRRFASYIEFASQAHKVAETNEIFVDAYQAHVTIAGLNRILGDIATEANTLRQLQWAVRLAGSPTMARLSAELAERAANILKFWGPDGFIGEYDVDLDRAKYLTDLDVNAFIKAAETEIT